MTCISPMTRDPGLNTCINIQTPFAHTLKTIGRIAHALKTIGRIDPEL